MTKRAALIVTGAIAGMAFMACSSSEEPEKPTLDRQALMDPETCNRCHEDHYREWSGSMHAYASEDPVFLAMNRRGQRETNGALGKFCVQCHAPMAVAAGATTDGLNLDTVPKKLKGVTCFFCHSVDAVSGTHNNPLHLAEDLAMRGEYGDAIDNSAHRSTYSQLHDRNHIDSSKLCGTCHDITTDLGGAVERTHAEWQASVFAGPNGATCSQCHMDQSTNLTPIAQYTGVYARRKHEHTFHAVDVALTPGVPESDVQRKKVQSFLDTTLQSALCVTQTGQIRVLLDNVAAGHGFPSGSGQDRRAFVEVTAYKGPDVVYQSGALKDGGALPTLAEDPDLWLLRDCMFDAAGKQVNMFWQAASYETNQLPAQVTFDVRDPRFYRTHLVQAYPRDSAATLPATPDRVTMRVRLQPMGMDVLDDLVVSGDLDPAVKQAMPTFDLGKPLEWTAPAATETYYEGKLKVTCVTATNFNVAADKVPAPARANCAP